MLKRKKMKLERMLQSLSGLSEDRLDKAIRNLEGNAVVDSDELDEDSGSEQPSKLLIQRVRCTGCISSF